MTARLFVEFALRATLIAAAAAFGLRALRIRTAAAQHAFWTGVLLLMLTLPGWIAWGPKAPLPVLPARSAPAGAMTAASIVEADPPSGSAAPRVDAKPRHDEPAPLGNWMWLGAYFLGAGVLLLRLAIGTIRANRLTIERCVVPVTVGFFRPRIILPECSMKWPDSQLDAVLTHERAHTRRRDPLVQWLALFNRAVFWFHPLAWWLERRLAALAEEVCDAAVLERGHDPRDYSRYLLELSRMVQRAGTRAEVTGMAMPGSYLAQRLRKIVAGADAPRVSTVRIAAAVCACAICSVVFIAGTLAQTRGDGERFEVASVKPSPPVLPGQRVFFGPARGGPGTSDPEQITWTYARMIDLLMAAYDVRPYQINGPGWISDQRYDVAAKVPPGATQVQVGIMGQNLLAERFGLRLHHEPKEFQVEQLLIAKGGPKLKETVIDDPDPGGPPQFNEKGQLTNSGRVVTIKPGPNGAASAHSVARAQPISTLASWITTQIGRPVLDETGLSGKYDYDLDFTFRLPAPAGTTAGDNASEPGPDIVAAIQQQLGLRLAPGKATLDVIVIDHLEKTPIAN